MPSRECRRICGPRDADRAESPETRVREIRLTLVSQLLSHLCYAASYLIEIPFTLSQLADAVPMNASPRAVLVTGCSSGIGRVIAEILASHGFRVFASVRCDDKAAELTALENPLLTPVILDVCNEEQVTQVIGQLAEQLPAGLYGLVNNAGVGLAAATELTSCDDLRHVLEVNTVAPLRMIQYCLPLLRKGRGRIVNVSSMNGLLALPMVGAYSASKHALEALSDTLRVELKPWRIPVCLIRPGQVRTPIFGKTRTQIAERSAQIPEGLAGSYATLYHRANKFNDRGAQSPTHPEVVAKKVVHALEARWPRTHYHVGWDALGMRIAKRCLPPWFIDRSLARIMGMLRRAKS